MSNFVVYLASSGRIVGNAKSAAWVDNARDPNLRAVAHPHVDPTAHRVVDGAVVAIPAQEVAAIAARLKSNADWRSVRNRRDLMLRKSDWTQIADAGRDRQAWAQYRQALRDLPQNTTNPRNPAWPTPPE